MLHSSSSSSSSSSFVAVIVLTRPWHMNPPLYSLIRLHCRVIVCQMRQETGRKRMTNKSYFSGCALNFHREEDEVGGWMMMSRLSQGRMGIHSLTRAFIHSFIHFGKQCISLEMQLIWNCFKSRFFVMFSLFGQKQTA